MALTFFSEENFPVLHTNYFAARDFGRALLQNFRLRINWKILLHVWGTFSFSFARHSWSPQYKSQHFHLFTRFPAWNVFDFNSTLSLHLSFLLSRLYISFLSCGRDKNAGGSVLFFFISFVFISCLAFACYKIALFFSHKKA